MNADLADFSRLDARFRYKFYRTGSEVACARWSGSAWELRGADLNGDLTGPQLQTAIAGWRSEGGEVMLWACVLPACNTPAMRELVGTLPNVTHGFCEACGPRYLDDLRAEAKSLKLKAAFI